METKTFCSNCKVHCYKPEMREKIRDVMRFPAPGCSLSTLWPPSARYGNQPRKTTTGGTGMKKVLYVILGCIGLGLGALGAALPLLPAFPS